MIGIYTECDQKRLRSQLAANLKGFMKIKNYLAYFHDGTLINISHLKNDMEISLESAELTDEDINDEIILSEHNTIRGKLHLENVKKNVKGMFLNNNPFHGVLKKEYDSGGIFDLEIKDNIVEISVKWVNYPPNPCIDDFSTIKIEAEKIWWENIPTLQNPAW